MAILLLNWSKWRKSSCTSDKWTSLNEEHFGEMKHPFPFCLQWNILSWESRIMGIRGVGKWRRPVCEHAMQRITKVLWKAVGRPCDHQYDCWLPVRGGEKWGFDVLLGSSLRRGEQKEWMRSRREQAGSCLLSITAVKMVHSCKGTVPWSECRQYVSIHRRFCLITLVSSLWRRRPNLASAGAG